MTCDSGSFYFSIQATQHISCSCLTTLACQLLFKSCFYIRAFALTLSSYWNSPPQILAEENFISFRQLFRCHLFIADFRNHPAYNFSSVHSAFSHCFIFFHRIYHHLIHNVFGLFILMIVPPLEYKFQNSRNFVNFFLAVPLCLLN